MQNTIFYKANLTRANFYGVDRAQMDLTGAVFCDTIMSDGRVRKQ
jgi:uncharacterized protein YjbI with pentapeptide repeats